MAISGTISGSTNNQYIDSAIDWTATSDIANNRSTVTAKLYYRRNNTGFTTSGTGSFSITINGVKFSSASVYLTIGTGWVLAMTATTTVTHNNDGSKSITISATGGLPGTSLTSTNCSGSVTLETIPRASSISCTKADIESKPTITISRASSSFRHTITYSFGSLTGTIATKSSATKITSWTIPASFYAQIPNAKTGKGTLTCTTYNGNTVIGTSTCDLNVTTNEAKCKPTVTGTVVDTNENTTRLTGDAENTLVRYYSTALCTIATTLNKSAGSIKAKTINNTVVTGNTLTIPDVETGVFDFWAKDSREYPGNVRITKTLIPYIKLTANVEAHRTDPTSGNATLTIKGNYYNGGFGEENNDLIVGYRLKGTQNYTFIKPTISGNEYEATAQLSGLTYTEAFTFDVIVEDKLATIPKPATIPKGVPVFDWGENDFRFNVPVFVGDNACAVGAFGQGVKIWYGGVNIFPTGANEMTVEEIDLPSGYFTETPCVFVSPRSTVPGEWRCSCMATKDKITVYFLRTNTVETMVSVFAIGK